MIPILTPTHRWYCPRCKQTAVTHKANEHPGHVCPKLRGLSVMFVPEGVAAKVEAREPEGYVGTQLMQTDENGRPVMSIVTTRDNGQDCAVLAPTATARLE